MKMPRLFAVLAVAAAVATLSACGGSGTSQPQTPTIRPARTFELSGFEPSGRIVPGKPTTVSFTVLQPDGRPLVHYRRGPGPHTGIHLIIVRTDLSTIIHAIHRSVVTGRSVSRSSFRSRGRYRMVVDLYPQPPGRSATSSCSARFACRARPSSTRCHRFSRPSTSTATG